MHARTRTKAVGFSIMQMRCFSLFSKSNSRGCLWPSSVMGRRCPLSQLPQDMPSIAREMVCLGFLLAQNRAQQGNAGTNGQISTHALNSDIMHCSKGIWRQTEVWLACFPHHFSLSRHCQNFLTGQKTKDLKFFLFFLAAPPQINKDSWDFIFFFFNCTW